MHSGICDIIWMSSIVHILISNMTIEGNVGISSVEKWSMETSTGASKNDMNLRLEDRR